MNMLLAACGKQPVRWVWLPGPRLFLCPCRGLTGFPARRVLGSGTLIDAAGVRHEFSLDQGIHANVLRAWILHPSLNNAETEVFRARAATVRRRIEAPQSATDAKPE